MRNQLLMSRAELLLNGSVVRQTNSIMMEFLGMKGRWNELLDLFKAMESDKYR